MILITIKKRNMNSGPRTPSKKRYGNALKQSLKPEHLRVIHAVSRIVMNEINLRVKLLEPRKG